MGDGLQWPWGGARSRAGLRSKNPVGRRVKPVYSTGITGKSSGREVGHAHRVPQRDAGVGDRAVRRGPGGQPGAAGMLVRELPGGPQFIVAGGSDPQVPGGERGAGRDGRGWLGQQRRAGVRRSPSGGLGFSFPVLGDICCAAMLAAAAGNDSHAVTGLNGRGAADYRRAQMRLQCRGGRSILR